MSDTVTLNSKFVPGLFQPLGQDGAADSEGVSKGANMWQMEKEPHSAACRDLDL